jgi:Tol biopolymer transport system component
MRGNSIVRVWLVGISTMLLTISGCNLEAQEQVHGLVYSDSDGLQVIGEKTRDELASWQALDGLCYPVALSPDGQKLVYTHTGQDLWLVNLGEGNSVELVEGSVRTDHADIMRMAWSPDGVWLALLVGQIYEGKPVPERVTLFVLQVNERHPTELASGVMGFTWMSNSEHIAYLSQAGQEYGGVYLAQPDGEGVRLLLEGGFEPFIEASPEGDSLAVVPWATTKNRTHSLLAVNTVDGVFVDLLHDFANLDDLQTLGWPTWSPDGTQIAFLGCVPMPDQPMVCASTLFVADVDGGYVKEVASDVSSPLAWSPTGKMIAFEKGALTRRIYRISLANNVMTEWANVDRCGHLFEWR